MTENLTDRTGAPMSVELRHGNPISAFTVSLGTGEPVGKAQFIDGAGSEPERVFFHTEVDEAYGGRGLGVLLVRESLRASREAGITVVPVCPLFARHLETHGEAYIAAGGTFRRPKPADLARVRAAVTGG